MMLIALIAPHSLLHRLIRSKVHRVRRSCRSYKSLAQAIGDIEHKPAPTITLDTPLHNDPKPSILEIVDTAFDRPV